MRHQVDPIRRACALWLTVATLPVHAQPSAELLGRWRSLSTSAGGIGAMFTFHEGGVVEYSLGAIVAGPYRLEGDQLILPSATKGGPEQRETVTWLSDDKVAFRSAAPADPGQEFSRVGSRASGPYPLVGEWRGSRELGGRTVTVIRIIGRNGGFLLLIPFVLQRGHYQVAEGRIRIELPAKPPVEGPFSLADNTLTLPGPNSTESNYERY